MTQQAIGALSMEKLVEKMCVDLYFGDGDQNPSITVRLDRIERLVKSVSRLFWAVVGTMFAVIADILVRIHK